MSAVPGAPMVDPSVRESGRRGNPWTTGFAIAGGALLGLGLLLLLVVGLTGNDGDARQLGLVGALSSICIALGGPLLFASLILAGVGWYIRDQTATLLRDR